MISVIICSAKPLLLKTVKENIETTIGVPYEILAIDNRDSGSGICKVYNEQAAKAKYEVLCFIHEDVILHTNGWGRILIDLLTDSSIGLVGISGTVYKSGIPAVWSACDSSLYRTHSIQHFANEPAPIINNFNPLQESFAEVAVIDGVLMATKKKVFGEFQFDEDRLKAFHGYDLDYSLQVGTKFKVVVTFGILLEHLSEGTLNAEWLKDSLLIHRKWEKVLPKMVIPLDPKTQEREDCIACQSVLKQVLINGSGIKKALYYWLTLVTRFLKYNGMKYSKATLKYIFSPGRI